MNPVLYVAGKLSPKAYYKVTQLRYKVPLLGRALSRLGNYIRNRDGVIQNGFGSGLLFNVGDSIAGYLLGTQEPHVQRTIAELVKPGMVAYDLGANVGFLSLLLARAVGPTGFVISFEPVPSNAEQLAYNARLNGFQNVTVRVEAVGKHDGTADFATGDFATIGKMQGGPTPSQHKVQRVAVRSLDSLVSSGAIPPPDFVKMDIEGAEVDCLRGAAMLLQKARPFLLIELHNTNESVQELLVDARYDSFVLGSGQAITSGHWNVQILAYPAERPLSGSTRDLLSSHQLTPWR